MGMFRIPIAWLMGFIVALGVALAALRGETELWASGMFTLALLVAGVAFLGARFADRRARAAWAGYLAFEAGYLLLVGGPWFADRVGPHLLTTGAIDARYDQMWYVPEKDDEVVWVARMPRGDVYNRGRTFSDIARTVPGEFRVLLDSGGNGSFTPDALREIGPESHRRLCHSVIALLIGFPGALIALAFANRGTDGREPASP